MLNTQTNLKNIDDFYAMLIESHEGLSNSQSQAMNAALVLILSNHIGQCEVIKQALDVARATALQSD